MALPPLVSGSSPNVPNRVESMPCALSTKTQPDSRGTSPAMTKLVLPAQPYRRRQRGAAVGAASVFELHPLLHTGSRTDPVAPGFQMAEPGIVGEHLAPGIDRVDRQIGGGELVPGEIGRRGELIVGKTPQIDEPVLVKLDRRVRHLFRH